MIREAWDGISVSRNTVAVTVAEVKKVLQEYGPWIRCRPKLGYRLEIPRGEESDQERLAPLESPDARRAG